MKQRLHRLDEAIEPRLGKLAAAQLRLDLRVGPETLNPRTRAQLRPNPVNPSPHSGVLLRGVGRSHHRVQRLLAELDVAAPARTALARLAGGR
jgi:hypothetical protein